MELLAGAAALVVAYLLGSAPTGVLVGRLLRGVDIRTYGSGSSGSTNVLRTLGPRAAAIVVLADIVKGAGAVLIALAFTGSEPLAMAMAGVAVVAGHSWPVFSGFRGGRGVMTGWGVMVVLSPIAAGVAALGFIVLAITRYASAGSLLGTAAAGIALLVLAGFGQIPAAYSIFAVGGAAMIIGRHLPNIVRLAKGTESRLESRPRPRRASTRHG